MSDGGNPDRVVQFDVVNRVGKARKPMFPGALIVDDRESLRHPPDTVERLLELPAKFAAETLALALVVRDGYPNFLLGLGMDRERFHG